MSNTKPTLLYADYGTDSVFLYSAVYYGSKKDVCCFTSQSSVDDEEAWLW